MAPIASRGFRTWPFVEASSFRWPRRSYPRRHGEQHLGYVAAPAPPNGAQPTSQRPILGLIAGLKLFGFWGFIFGPLLISYLLLLIRIYRSEFGGPVKSPNPPST